MAKAPPKLSGLIKTGAVVPATPAHELADIPGPGASAPLEPYAPPAADEAPTQEAQATAVDSHSRRNLTMLGVHLIDPNPLAPREIYTPEMILNRAEDLRAQGQHDPIHVIPNPNATGRFII